MDPVRSQTKGSVAVRCLYCKGGLDTAVAVYCARCLTPYHQDCFAGHGACSVFGCEERRVVRPLAPKEFAPLRPAASGKGKGEAKPRSRPWLPALVLAAGVGSAGAIAAWRGFEPTPAPRVAVATPAVEAPRPEPEPLPEPAAEAPPAKPETRFARFDHSALDRLLKAYVDGEGLVDYQAWKSSAEDRKALDAYLAAAGAADSKALSREGRIAFLINVYNAWTLKKVLGHYPTKSILDHDIRTKDPESGIWDGQYILLDGERVSLNHIAKQVLVKELGEPRVHFALVPGAMGAPPLLNAAWTGERLEGLFERQARTFLAFPDNFWYEAQANKASISKLFDWYKSDFGGTDENPGKVQVALSKYVPDPKARQALAAGSAQVRFLDFDWSLNDQRLLEPRMPTPEPETEPAEPKKEEPKPAKLPELRLAPGEGDPWPSDLKKGEFYFKKGYYVKAGEEYRKVVLKDETRPIPQLAFGHALTAMGNYHYASHSYRRVAKVWPEGEVLHPRLIELFPTRLSFDRTLDDLKRYVRFNRRDPSALAVLALVYFSNDELAKAKTICGYLRLLDREDAFAAFIEAQVELHQALRKKE